MVSQVERTKQIKDLLSKNPGMSGRDISKSLGISTASVSLAMKQLKESEQVEMRRKGRGTAAYLTSSAAKRRLINKHFKDFGRM